MKERSTFGSRFGAIAVVGGSAVGLGNIWKFPYVAGQNGGAAFVIIYVAISFLISIPVMLSEFSIGRHSRRNVLGAFRSITPQRGWQGVGWLSLIAAFVILSFYSVISGWSIEFIKESVVGGFAGRTPAEVQTFFTDFVSSGWRPVIYTLLFVALNCVIVGLGVEKGIERYSKILMPLLALLLVGLAVRSAFLSGFGQSVDFLFRPDWSKINGSVVVQALGQSFFSMSIGMGAMITYGSYLNSRENMFRIAATVAVTDVVIAVVAGLAIFPAVFTFGINPTSGPDLVFLTLPTLFAQIGGGYLISIVFFLLLLFAAITSSFSMLEVIVAYLVEEFDLTRFKANVVAFLSVGLLSSLCALSQVPGSKIRLFGSNLFDLFDYVSSNLMLPLGGLAIVIFVGWFMDRKIRRDQFTSYGTSGVAIYPFVVAMIKFVVPVAIIVMFLSLIKVI